MNLFRFLRKTKPPPEPCEVQHDQAAMDALGRARENMDEGEAHLREIVARRQRLEKVRRENHFAPAIRAAFKGSHNG